MNHKITFFCFFALMLSYTNLVWTAEMQEATETLFNQIWRRCGSVAIAQKAIKDGANINEKRRTERLDLLGSSCETPLSRAISSKNPKMVKLLLDHKVDIRHDDIALAMLEYMQDLKDSDSLASVKLLFEQKYFRILIENDRWNRDFQSIIHTPLFFNNKLDTSKKNLRIVLKMLIEYLISEHKVSLRPEQELEEMREKTLMFEFGSKEFNQVWNRYFIFKNLRGFIRRLIDMDCNDPQNFLEGKTSRPQNDAKNLNNETVIRHTLKAEILKQWYLEYLGGKKDKLLDVININRPLSDSLAQCFKPIFLNELQEEYQKRELKNFYKEQEEYMTIAHEQLYDIHKKHEESVIAKMRNL